MLALIYDVHGNLPALEAVIDDARTAGADQWILGGDYAAFGAWPAATVERLRNLDGPALWIRGNWERWAASPEDAPEGKIFQGALEHVRAELGDQLCRVLGSLPPEGRYADDTRICHGTPVSDVDWFPPAPAVEDVEKLAGIAEGRVVFGHTHIQFRRTAVRVDLINPGSVGMPFDGDPRAAYGLIHDDGKVELRRVEYDHVASAEAVAEIGETWAGVTAERILRSTLDV